MAKPGDLKEGDYVGRLYERLNSQMEKIESALKNAGQEHTAFSQMAGEIHSNVEFMNQVNQMYTYAQIPLKMSGQHASGELFVYTNKKALAQGEKDLTAFLHLDLDHLGSTDVSVRMDHRGLAGTLSLSAGGNDRKKCYGNTPVVAAVGKWSGRGGVQCFLSCK
jgi:hypothetical protein